MAAPPTAQLKLCRAQATSPSGRLPLRPPRLQPVPALQPPLQGGRPQPHHVIWGERHGIYTVPWIPIPLQVWVPLVKSVQSPGTPVDRLCELMVTQEGPDPPTCVEEKPSLGESSMSSKEALNTEDLKMPKDSEVTTEADIKPKSVRRAKTWSDVVENLYRFQQAGYRDEVEYKQVKQVEQVDFWPETGFVKKLQRRDNTFYYYNRQRECEDKDVRKVKIYVY
uniref:Meiosis/spermiogenesis associated 1 n=4 Tax=Passerellidae TaxID=1729112 RepID=A0A8C5IDH7_JUNHY